MQAALCGFLSRCTGGTEGRRDERGQENPCTPIAQCVYAFVNEHKLEILFAATFTASLVTGPLPSSYLIYNTSSALYQVSMKAIAKEFAKSVVVRSFVQIVVVAFDLQVNSRYIDTWKKIHKLFLLSGIAWMITQPASMIGVGIWATSMMGCSLLYRAFNLIPSPRREV